MGASAGLGIPLWPISRRCCNFRFASLRGEIRVRPFLAIVLRYYRLVRETAYRKRHATMTTKYNICLLPGDGIGPEIIAEGVKVLNAVGAKYDTEFACEESLIGGAAIDAASRFPRQRSMPRRPPMPCCSLLWADRSGTRPTRTPRALSRVCSASARGWDSIPTCVPCRFSTRSPAPQR